MQHTVAYRLIQTCQMCTSKSPRIVGSDSQTVCISKQKKTLTTRRKCGKIKMDFSSFDFEDRNKSNSHRFEKGPTT